MKKLRFVVAFLTLTMSVSLTAITPSFFDVVRNIYRPVSEQSQAMARELFVKGDELLLNGATQNAAVCFDKALSHNRYAAPAWLGLGCCYYDEGYIAQAVSYAKHALHLMPSLAPRLSYYYPNLYSLVTQ